MPTVQVFMARSYRDVRRHGVRAARDRDARRAFVALLRPARGIDGRPAAAAGRRASAGPANGTHLGALASSAEEAIAAVGLEPRDTDSRRHLEPRQDRAGTRIDPAQLALVAFPRPVPQLAV